ncbi:ANTAR domain-containing protein [Lentzea sp. NBRC 105346]|uniref:ANTAR domain-containing protein n=1 Tax=Lentzea sp. NBRC 105346 TaxID=3032205 RepID=UPI0024A55CB9|nr:ANTAR domain-containing protein [Lentzea sp. NBRC 105346]GLZ31012.1 ANTAR domain-containing protein [Lentzea sp. NBRC 105346]
MFSLEEFLGKVVQAIVRDLPGLRGVDIAALRPRQPHHAPVVFAAHGVAVDLQDLQMRNVSGPTLCAAQGHRPIVSKDVWHDQRWPRLSLAGACASFPQSSGLLHSTRGAVALPGLHDNGSQIVVSAYFSEAPDDDVVGVVMRHERLVAAAIVAASAFSGPVERTRRVLSVLQSRADVQQAQGVIMALCRTDPLTAAALLHDISNRSALLPGELAAELVRFVGDPGAVSITHPKARRVASELWTTLNLTRDG